MFRFGRPETPGHWIIHILMAIVALFLIWWMFRAFVL
jgi:Mg2+ and Co2+ transporter CorA